LLLLKHSVKLCCKAIKAAPTRDAAFIASKFKSEHLQTAVQTNYWGGASVPGASAGSSVGATAGSSAGATAGSSAGAVVSAGVSVPEGAQAPTANAIPRNKGRAKNFNFIAISPDNLVIHPYNQSVRKPETSPCSIRSNLVF
jgi:hypothetical protein